MGKGKKSKKKPFKKWEKWFILVSSLLVGITVIVYASRLIYYYKLEHPSVVDNSLRTHIIKEGTVYSGDGLYTFNQDEYYYVGMDVSNYLWYSGRLWRIISIDNKGIKMITDKSQSSIVWGINTDYDNSYIKRWLDDDLIFLKSLGNYSEYLVKGNFCIDKISLEKVTCNNYMDSYVGLLSVSEYLRANGKNSYLNNQEYFWLMNTTDGNRAYYVFSEGGINNETSFNETYYSYGVRPVVVLGNQVNYYGGDGTLDNPYQVNMNSDNSINSKSVGEYVLMDGYRFRIQDKGDDSVRLVMDEYVKSDTEDIKKNFKNTISYLNKDFYNSLTKENLVKCEFKTGDYGKKSNYDYRNVSDNGNSNYVGVPSIGEIFTLGFENYWLYNAYDENTSLQYKSNSDGRIIADDSNNKNYIRAVICIRNDLVVSEGTGLKDSPYVVIG